jgi:hypothetical protein
MSIYINREVVLLYFIAKGRIKAFETEIQPSDWLELSENRCARTNADAAAADRISELGYLSELTKPTVTMKDPVISSWNTGHSSGLSA